MARLLLNVFDGILLAPVVRSFIATWTRRNAKDQKANYLAAMTTVGIVGALLSSFAAPALSNVPTALSLNETKKWKTLTYGIATSISLACALAATLSAAVLVLVFSLMKPKEMKSMLARWTRWVGLPYLGLMGACTGIFISTWVTTEIVYESHFAVLVVGRLVLGGSLGGGIIVTLLIVYYSHTMSAVTPDPFADAEPSYIPRPSPYLMEEFEIDDDQFDPQGFDDDDDDDDTGGGKSGLVMKSEMAGLRDE